MTCILIHTKVHIMRSMKFLLAMAMVLTLVTPNNSQTSSTLSFLSLVLQERISMNEPADDPITQLEYDFIIVGAGSAGCVIANRLTEVEIWNVLLLEAGPAETWAMDIPILASALQITDSTWQYRTQPSFSSLQGFNNSFGYPMGKVMGGSSSVNYMIYTRGNEYDFDNWARLGNVGWSYNDTLPYFKKSEDILVKELAKSNYHSTGGYLKVSYPPYRSEISKAFVNASNEMGEDEVDYNGINQKGFSFLQSTMKDGVRWSSSRSFLHPIRMRTNLHVKKLSLVRKILIDSKTKTAYGVEFIKDGKEYKIVAKKEVIVAAGSINSPQLLMVSGIGPKEHLRDLNISLIKDLKVGYNFHDHVGQYGVSFTCNVSTFKIEAILADSNNLFNYLSYGQGPFTLTAGIEAIAFLNSNINSEHYPDIEIFSIAGGPAENPAKALGLKREIYNEMFRPIQNKSAFLLFPLVLRPKSRGRLMLKDSNIMSKPLIQPNMLNEEEDIETLVRGIKLTINMSKTNAFQKIGTKLNEIPVPPCKSHAFNSDDYWKCAVRQLAIPTYHPVGTCKMGPLTDKEAVVDPQLKVHGIKNLRVADASIMPQIVSAHTLAATYMIAEKVSDLIKKDHI